MCVAGGLRGRGRHRQGTRCEGYCGAMLSAPWTARPPAPGNGHTHEEQAARDACRLRANCADLAEIARTVFMPGYHIGGLAWQRPHYILYFFMDFKI
jgi:hypothetical protein